MYQGDWYIGTILGGYIDSFADEVRTYQAFAGEFTILQFCDLVSLKIKFVDLIVDEWRIEMEA